MKYEFTIKGHDNILGTHRNTIEFTKDKDVSKQGDCIIGVQADFILEELEKFLGVKQFTITIRSGDVEERIVAKPNIHFSDENELVIRKGDFDSARTFAIHADKAAKDLPVKLIENLRKNGGTVVVEGFINKS